MAHKCNKEVELTEMHGDIKFIKNRLVGNGEKGMFRKVDSLELEVNKFNDYTHFKNWILGGTIVFMGTMIGFLIGYRFF